VKYVGRKVSASTAVGSGNMHKLELARLLENLFA